MVLRGLEHGKRKALGMSDETVKRAMQHANTLGAGAKKRAKLGKKEKIHTVMKEFERGTLHSGSGFIVTNPKQAIAIAMSEARKKGKR
jgi:hypothetical protein